MKALAVLHDHCSAPGLIGDALAAAGWEIDTVTIVGSDRFNAPDVDFDFPDVEPYDLIVPFGAPWSVYDTNVIGAWVQPELDWLSAATAADTPVLGVCFGGQLLARALGGTVVLAETPEVGWHDVSSDDDALVPSGPWFQWHYDRFTLPPGATSIARNAATEQAFVHGRSMGLQFHPELTSDILQGWLDMGGDAKARALDLDPGDLVKATEHRHLESAARTRALVEGYLSTIF
ncbi:type 1 glutamine amidotransferase [Aeromicrobium sp. CF3.5]|uniref:type 1 glutamine amidotransferase n=1 Tax=Aeromicrobium sp. CF3.5 TaxID=3373078 RepID=UPI003EE74351